jgi:hypothetical protein
VRTATGRTEVYSLGTTPLREADDWLARYRAAWPQRLDALDTEPLWEAASSAPAAG